VSIQIHLGLVVGTHQPTFALEVDGRRFERQIPVHDQTAHLWVPDEDAARIAYNMRDRIIEHVRKMQCQVTKLEIHIG
jgi:hypothetical protein